ncbi:MAG: hypothetical protein WD749_12455 [Phycisphaerales bacterium]
MSRSPPVRAVTLLAVAGAAAASHAQVLLHPLVVVGDPVPGIGNVTSITDIAVNSAGSWAVAVATDHPNGNANTLILRDGQVAMREDDPAPGTGTTISFIGTSSLGPAGELGVRIGLRNAQSGQDSAIVRQGQLVVRAGAPCTDPNVPAGTLYYSFFRSAMNESAQFFAPCALRWGGGQLVRAAARITLDPQTGSTAQQLIVRPGDTLPGLGQVTDVLNGVWQGDINNSGHAVFTALSGNFAGIFMWTPGATTALAIPNGASPLPGRQWLNLTSAAVALGDGGDTAVAGSISGEIATNAIIARNGAVYRQKGQPLPGLAQYSLTGFGVNRGPRLTADGRVLWFADWNGPAAANAGVFLQDRMLAQEGDAVQTPLGVLAIKSFALGDFGAVLVITPDGRYVVTRVVLTDGTTDGAAAILIDTAAPVCYANCDGSTAPPVLNVGDFGCYLQKFAAGLWYANCDGSTTPPVLNVGDFGCFLQRFAAGCP